jgi:hypothetical protein
MANTPSVRHELVVDERGRTRLDKVRKTHHARYEVTEFPGGVLVLVPLVTRRAAEMPSAAQLAALTAPADG